MVTMPSISACLLSLRSLIISSIEFILSLLKNSFSTNSIKGLALSNFRELKTLDLLVLLLKAILALNS